MRKLIESTLVTIGGDIGAPDRWGAPFMDEEFSQSSNRLLSEADALLLGRVTYEHFAKAYPAMASGTKMGSPKFIERMNSIPKYVASTTLRNLTWNAQLLQGDTAEAVAALKQQPGKSLLKYGTGTLDRTLFAHRLIDELHLWVHPVATGSAQRLFDGIVDTVQLRLMDVHRFKSGLVVLVYSPK
jgi:dihydrofolate reductase